MYIHSGRRGRVSRFKPSEEKNTSKHLYAGQKSDKYQGGGGIGRGSIQRMINLSFTMYITIDIYLNAYMYNLDSTCQQKLQIPPRNRDVALIMYSWAAPVNKHVLLHDSSTPQRTMRAAVPRSF